MCPRCEGLGNVNDFDLSALYDDSKSLNEGALTVPGYSMDGWYGRIFRGCGWFDPDKPIRDFTPKELDALLYKQATKVKIDGINVTYLGLIPQIQKSYLSKDVEAMQRALRDINQLTADKILRPLVVRVFPFDEFVEAHRYMDDCPCRGRVALALEA